MVKSLRLILSLREAGNVCLLPSWTDRHLRHSDPLPSTRLAIVSGSNDLDIYNNYFLWGFENECGLTGIVWGTRLREKWNLIYR